MTKNIAASLLLQKHFDTALETPDGIKKLRALILTLAMQGELVPQDPADQPASELLKEIEAEKKQLVMDGKIRKQEPLPAIKDNEIPYEVSVGWKWVRFGIISQHNSGKTLDSGRNIGEYRDYITTSNLYWGFFKLDNIKQMPIKDEELERCSAKKGDLLICEGGEAGRAAVWCYDYDICFQNHIHRARLLCDINSFFIYNFFEKLNATGEISKYRQGVGISNMSGKALTSILVPLPPIAEQHRIVAKIDQLMALCDKLEEQRNERSQKRLAVHASAINRLLSESDGEAFSTSWDFITAHFNELYSVRQNVADLKKAILQLAVMGKLVPQDPTDQPASELLKEIAEEKKRLVKEGKIRNQEPLPAIKNCEIPYEVPVGWEWVRLGDISSKIHYGYTASADYDLKDIRMLRITDIQDNKVNWESVPGCEIKGENVDQYLLNDNDILIARTGGTVGKSYLVENVSVKAVFASYLIRIVPSYNIDVKYLKNFIEGPIYWKQLYEKCSGTGQPNVNGTSLSTLLLTLPPLAEQKRIVAKIDQLMALCDELDKQITDATEKKSAILNAVLASI
jgi:type I restriction enzyme S subunit